MRAWAAAGVTVATVGMVWLTAVLASSEWPAVLRSLATVPMAVLWAATIVAAIQAFFRPARWPTSTWLGALGIAAVLLAIARVLGSLR